MTERQDKDYINNRAYNMRVIRDIWEYLRGRLGDTTVHGNENNNKYFYGTFEKSRQSVREIINGEGNYNEKLVMKWAQKIAGKTGISADILAGKKRICLSKKFDEKYFPKYQEYVDYCEWINEQYEEVYLSEERLKSLINNKKEKEETLSKCRKAKSLIEMFDEYLKNEISELDRRGGYTKGDDPDTFKIYHFIKYKKPYDAVSVVTIDNVINVFEKTRTKQLLDLGEKGLHDYIQALKKQLELAEAVYTVAVDVGDFKEIIIKDNHKK